MSDFEQLVGRVEDSPRPAVEVPLLLDAEAAARHRELEAELERAVASPGDGIEARGVAAIAEDIAGLYEQSSPTTFRFVPMDPKEWSDLAAANPPRKGKREDVNPDGFWPAAMARSCSEPDGATEELFLRLRASLSNGQWNRLITGCREANEGAFDLRPSVTASAVLRTLQRSSPTADLEVSPEASS